MIILLKFIVSLVVSIVAFFILYCCITLFDFIIDFTDKHFPLLTKYLEIILIILIPTILFFIFSLIV